MPIYNDSPIVLNINSTDHQGVTILVRYLGILKHSSFWKFIADIHSDLDWDGHISFWNDDFSVDSGTASFGVDDRHIESFSDWVFCSDINYFYVTIYIDDWKTHTDIQLTLYNSYIVKGYDSVLINRNGNLIRKNSVYNSGIVLDLIDSSGSEVWVTGSFVDDFDNFSNWVETDPGGWLSPVNSYAIFDRPAGIIPSPSSELNRANLLLFPIENEFAIEIDFRDIILPTTAGSTARFSLYFIFDVGLTKFIEFRISYVKNTNIFTLLAFKNDTFGLGLVGSVIVPSSTVGGILRIERKSGGLVRFLYSAGGEVQFLADYTSVDFTATSYYKTQLYWSCQSRFYIKHNKIEFLKIEDAWPLGIRDTRYEDYADNFLERMVSVHLAIREKRGIYPRVFVDGDFRAFNNAGDSIIVVSFDDNTNIDFENISLVYAAGNITCTTGLGADVQAYTIAQFYVFTITSGPQVQTIEVWIDLDRDPGSIGSINTVAVKKYLTGMMVEQKGFEYITRSVPWMNYYKTVKISDYSEEVNFAYDSDWAQWRAGLSYHAIQDQNLAMLTRNRIPLPTDVWNFVSSNTITIDNIEYDSSAVYRFEYKIDQYMIYDIDVSGFIGITEMYLLPFADMFSLRDTDTREIDREEQVIFDINGVGYLRLFSNNNLADIKITRVRSTGEEVLPASAIISLEDDIVKINSSYVSSSDLYIVNYKAEVGEVKNAADVTISWRYKLVGPGYSAWEEWDGKTLAPWKYFDSGTQDISNIQLKIKIDTTDDLVYIRGAGLIVLGLRHGELM